GTPPCLPWPFELARVGELIAISAQKIAAREVQLGYAPPALSAVSRSGADEIGATAAEPTKQMNDGNRLGHLFVSPMPDLRGVGEHGRAENRSDGRLLQDKKIVATPPGAFTHPYPQPSPHSRQYRRDLS